MWHLIEGEAGCRFAVEKGCVAVVVDALRASATAAMLLERGARELVVVRPIGFEPMKWIRALALRRETGEDDLALDDLAGLGILVAPGSACDRLFREIGLKLHRPGHGARPARGGASPRRTLPA